jgi:MFS family permease
MTSGEAELVTDGVEQSSPGHYRQLATNREVVAIISARTLSGLGDQVARLVLALYVLTGTDGGPLTAALVLAVAYIPGTIGSAALGSLADRFPRRAVILTADIIRAVLIGVLALAVSFDSALWLLLAILLLVELLGPPALSARRALLADVSRDPEEFVAANGLASALDQVVQVVGFIFGAIAIGLFTATWALLFDAGTFVASFVLIAALVQHRPAAAQEGTSARRMWTDMIDAARSLRREPAVGAFVVLSWCAAGLLVATDSVALPYAENFGSSDLVAGIMLAATPAGAALSALWVAQLPVRRQLVVMFPMAFASTIPLMLTLFEPRIVIALALWFVAGLLQGYIVTVMAQVVAFTAPQFRGRVVGVASAGFNAVAMLTIVGLGALAEVVGAGTAIAAAGALGVFLLGGVYLTWPARDVSRAMRATYGPVSG